MTTYKITLPDEKVGSYYFINSLVLLLNAALFLYIAFQQQAGWLKTWSIIGAIISTSFFLILLVKKIAKPLYKWLWFAFVLLGFCWLMMENYSAVLLLALLSLLGYITSRRKLIEVNDAGIVYPSFPVKKISWNKVEQVMLKDGVLSIDLKNNQLFQFSLDAAEAELIPETQFNQFCAARQLA